jgi:hypothetical protein
VDGRRPWVECRFEADAQRPNYPGNDDVNKRIPCCAVLIVLTLFSQLANLQTSAYSYDAKTLMEAVACR